MNLLHVYFVCQQLPLLKVEARFTRIKHPNSFVIFFTKLKKKQGGSIFESNILNRFVNFFQNKTSDRESEDGGDVRHRAVDLCFRAAPFVVH